MEERPVIDWDDAFDNSGYVPEAKDLPPKWASQAKAWRDTLLSDGRAQIDQAYGARDRERFDLFLPPGPSKGTVIFVHGGYWRLFDKSYWSHLSKGCLAHGWAVAMPSYPLAPEARIAQITDAIARAVATIADATQGPIVLAGHSAGGHLVTRMMCEGVLPDAVTKRLCRVMSISGVHHLDPLVATKMNDDLRLSASEAAAESPVHLDPVPDIPVSIVVGDHERPEFLRQSRMLAERWALRGADVQTIFDAGTNHFNVINTLGDPGGLLTQELLR